MPKRSKARRSSHRRLSTASMLSSGTDFPSGPRSRSESSSSQTAASLWTAEDDQTLASARAAGMNWQPIAAQYFRGKTANACRKRHERLMERRMMEDWGPDRLGRLAVAYLDLREELWALLADRLGEKWAVVEAKVMEMGLKNLNNIARACYRRRRSDVARAEEYAQDEYDMAQVLSDLHRPLPTPPVGVHRRTQSAQSARRPLPPLPLYEPPANVMGGTSFEREDGSRRQSISPRDMCSIQALLSHPE